MRTKALLLTAAIGAMGMATSMAQVYSINIVGYINKNLPAGLSMIANQLNATPNNKLSTLLPAPTASLTISKFDHATGNFVNSNYDLDNVAWSNPDMVLAPGEGAFVLNTSPTPLPVTFVGEVQLTSTIPILPGLAVYSSVIPQAGNLNALGFPALTTGMTLSRYNPATGQFVNSNFDADNGAWSPDVPSVEIAESFFILSAADTTINWQRTFTVGP